VAEASVSQRAAADRPAADLAALRILIVHEWLYTWAGAERVLEELLTLLPQADILAGIVTPEMRARHPIARRAIESWVGRMPGARRHHRWFLPLHAAAFASHDTSGYDLIVSISHAFEKSVRATGGAPHVCYCLSPPRYLWDLSDEHTRIAAPPQRLALRASRGALRAVDRWAAQSVTHFVSLSRHVAARVKRAYGRDSSVVYPPVDSKGETTRATPPEPFLLTIGRLVPYKRVDLMIRAAARLGMRLVVCGEGPERKRLEALAGDSVGGGPSVSFLGHVDERRAAALLSSCSAFVFCAEEDFGIAPVEANAHGAPVVCFAGGGVLETMRDGETATFFHEQHPDALADAIRMCLLHNWDAAALQANAGRFAPHRFRDGMRAEIAKALAGGGRVENG
jgi:glycosyltransferase involved in cell wall biosynthesis